MIKKDFNKTSGTLFDYTTTMTTKSFPYTVNQSFYKSSLTFKNATNPQFELFTNLSTVTYKNSTTRSENQFGLKNNTSIITILVQNSNDRQNSQIPNTSTSKIFSDLSQNQTKYTTKFRELNITSTTSRTESSVFSTSANSTNSFNIFVTVFTKNSTDRQNSHFANTSITHLPQTQTKYNYTTKFTEFNITSTTSTSTTNPSIYYFTNISSTSSSGKSFSPGNESDSFYTPKNTKLPQNTAEMKLSSFTTQARNATTGYVNQYSSAVNSTLHSITLNGFNATTNSIINTTFLKLSSTNNTLILEFNATTKRTNLQTSDTLKNQSETIKNEFEKTTVQKSTTKTLNKAIIDDINTASSQKQTTKPTNDSKTSSSNNSFQIETTKKQIVLTNEPKIVNTTKSNSQRENSTIIQDQQKKIFTVSPHPSFRTTVNSPISSKGYSTSTITSSSLEKNSTAKNFRITNKLSTETIKEFQTKIFFIEENKPPGSAVITKIEEKYPTLLPLSNKFDLKFIILVY